MKKCETFGCVHQGIQMCQIAPGTNVWLCKQCLREMGKDDDA
ncbi:MAG: hypothetical protein ACE5Q6_03535 [Dehalococcoidia bacterium]